MVAALSSSILKTGSKATEGKSCRLSVLNSQDPEASRLKVLHKHCCSLANSISSITVLDSGNFMELKKVWLIQRMLPKPVVPLDQYMETVSTCSFRSKGIQQ